MHLKVLSEKWRPFCLGLNVLNLYYCWMWEIYWLKFTLKKDHNSVCFTLKFSISDDDLPWLCAKASLGIQLCLLCFKEYTILAYILFIWQMPIVVGTGNNWVNFDTMQSSRWLSVMLDMKNYTCIRHVISDSYRVLNTCICSWKDFGWIKI